MTIGAPATEMQWRVSGRCEGGQCVEVGIRGEAVVIRSSADPDGVRITLTRDQWRKFAAEVKERIPVIRG